MKIERSKNAFRNIIFGSLLKIYQIIVPFLMRSAMIYFMGVKYLGLSSLFTSILQILNLTELGVGSAMVFSMYKPIAENNVKKICSLMALYKIYYRWIGLVIGVIGIALTPFLPHLVKGTWPQEINIYVLYMLNLATTVASYWLYAYKNCLFSAHQRNDAISKVTLVTQTFQYGMQFIVIVFLKDYYLYVIVALATQVITNLAIAYAADKTYPEYKPSKSLDKNLIKDINQRIKDLFTSKVGAVVLNSTDTVVISAFLGLEMLAIYQNYFFILSSITTLVAVFFHSSAAGIGNSLVVENEEKNFAILKQFTLLIAWIATICSCCFLCLFQPFMRMWVGEELMLNFSVVICFCIYYYVSEINQLLNTFKDAAGIWHEDRWRPLITSMVNLGLNLIMVNFCGIYGILLSTILAMLIVGMPWLLHNLFTVLFSRKYLKEYLIKLGIYVSVAFLSTVLCYWVCQFVYFSEFLTLIFRVVICLIISNGVLYIMFRKTEEFRYLINILDNLFKGKLPIKQWLLK